MIILNKKPFLKKKRLHSLSTTVLNKKLSNKYNIAYLDKKPKAKKSPRRQKSKKVFFLE